MLSGAEVDLELEAIVNKNLLASCLRLVEHAISVVDEGGRRRWIDLCSQLLNIPRAEDLDEDEALLRKLSMRFLLKDPSQQVWDEGGLQQVFVRVSESLNDDGRFTGVRHRNLLLVPTDNSKTWEQFDILEKIPDNDRNGALILTWACQRFAASLTDNSTLSALPPVAASATRAAFLA